MTRPPRGLSAEEAALWEKVTRTVVPLDPPSASLGEGDRAKRGGGTDYPPPAGEGDHRNGGGGAPSSNTRHPGEGRDLLQQGALPKEIPASAGMTARARISLHQPAAGPPFRAKLEENKAGLDSHQDRRFKSGAVAPDFTLDLHGLTLDQAYTRLQDGIAQARALEARVVLLIAGKPRPVEAADRGSSRGAIRAKLLDWLAAGPHAGSIAAVRKAHRRHGGEGALYVVLRKR